MCAHCFESFVRMSYHRTSCLHRLVLLGTAQHTEWSRCVCVRLSLASATVFSPLEHATSANLRAHKHGTCEKTVPRGRCECARCVLPSCSFLSPPGARLSSRVCPYRTKFRKPDRANRAFSVLPRPPAHLTIARRVVVVAGSARGSSLVSTSIFGPCRKKCDVFLI